VLGPVGLAGQNKRVGGRWWGDRTAPELRAGNMLAVAPEVGLDMALRNQPPVHCRIVGSLVGPRMKVVLYATLKLPKEPRSPVWP
jgi:hypothetical protein